jgi:hypothetical protein
MHVRVQRHAPEQSQSGRDFDEAIDPKAHQRNTPGKRSRADGDQALHAVPHNREVFQPLSAPGKSLPIRHRRPFISSSVWVSAPMLSHARSGLSAVTPSILSAILSGNLQLKPSISNPRPVETLCGSFSGEELRRTSRRVLLRWHRTKTEATRRGPTKEGESAKWLAPRGLREKRPSSAREHVTSARIQSWGEVQCSCVTAISVDAAGSDDRFDRTRDDAGLLCVLHGRLCVGRTVPDDPSRVSRDVSQGPLTNLEAAGRMSR